jgi:hypothetical protein
MLATRDAHRLYQRFGFRPADPTMLMEIVRAGLYRLDADRAPT